MDGEASTQGVTLPEGHTPESYLHSLLRDAVAAFPDALSPAELTPHLSVFAHAFDEQLYRFELRRAAHAQRVQIARFLCQRVATDFRFSDGTGTRSLAEAVREEARPVPLTCVTFPEAGRFTPSVTFGRRLCNGPKLAILIEELVQRRALTTAAAQALSWITREAGRRGGLSLQGERIALLGAAADLSPAAMLLEAGASVLWIDLKDPSPDLLLDRRLGGTLYYPRDGFDLLRRPQAIRATLSQFAQDGPIHVWSYAHARQEHARWPLAAAMHAIAHSLPQAMIESLATVMSPAIAAGIDPTDAEAADAEALEATRSRRILARVVKLGEGHVQQGDTRIARAIVPPLGVSHQGVHYLSRMLGAESLAVYGTSDASEHGAAPTVSANIAPITRIRSLTHPLAEATLEGAKGFGILVADAMTTRALCGLLTLHDILNPAAPGARGRRYPNPREHARALLSQQIHGGLYAQPYSLAGIVRATAMKEFARRPRLAFRWIRGAS